MNDVDFPGRESARRHRRGGGGGSHAGQDQHGGEARRERGEHPADGAPLPRHAATSCASSSTWTSAHTNGWRMDDVVTAREIVETISAEMPLEPVDRQLPRRSRRALALPRRQRRDRRHRVGHAGVLPRLHARAHLHRRQALHVPLRHARATTCARCCAPAPPTTRSQARSARSGRAAPTATRRSAARRRCRSKKIEMSYIGG